MNVIVQNERDNFTKFGDRCAQWNTIYISTVRKNITTHYKHMRNNRRTYNYLQNRYTLYITLLYENVLNLYLTYAMQRIPNIIKYE